MLDDMLTTAQVAARLSMTRQGVIARVDAGTLTPAYRQPATGGYLFFAADLDTRAVAA
jgi:hypothetical protein